MLKKTILLMFLTLGIMGCSSNSGPSVAEFIQKNDLDPSIKEQLVAQVLKTDEKVFCEYQGLGIDETELYLYTICQSFTAGGEKGEGASVPVAVGYQEQDGKYIIQNLKIPEGPLNYVANINAIFPDNIAEDIHQGKAMTSSEKQKLEAQILIQANQYFNKN